MKNLFLVFIILMSYNLNSQETSIIGTIISSDISIEEKEKQLNLFFKTKKDSLTTLELADCLHDYATNWLYKTKKDTKSAIFYLKEAIRIKDNFKDSQTRSYKRSLYNLGVFYKKELNYFEAISIFGQITAHKHSDIITSKAYKELGILYSKTGDYSKAMESFKIVVKNSKNKKLLTTVYLEQARNLINQQNFFKHKDEICSYLNKADNLLQNQTKLTNNNLVLNQLKSIIYTKTKNYSKALPHLNYTLNHSENIPDEYLAVAYNNLGVANHDMGNHKKAKELYEKVINFKTNLLGFLNYGELYIDLKKYNKGLLLLQNGIKNSVSEKKEVSIYWLPSLEEIQTTPYKLDLLDLLIEKANAWLKYYEYDKNENHLVQAVNTFSLADKLVDIIRYESTEYQSKLYWRAKGSTLYVNAVKACHYLNNAEQAFYFMEKNKALLLLEDITNEQAKLNSKLPVAVAKKEFDLKSAIFLAKQELLETKKNPNTNKGVLEDAVFKKKYHYKKFIDSISILYPKYAAFKKQVKVLSGKELPYILKEQNIVLLQYIIGEREGYFIYSTSNKLILFEIKNVSKLQNKIDQLLKLLQEPIYTTAELNTFQSLSNSVYNSLIPEKIRSELKGKHLVITPDQILHKLPFETLFNVKNNHFLIEDTQVSYAYSISHLKALNNIKNENKKELLAFIPVNFNDKTLYSLPLSEIELQKISSHYPSHSFTKENATKQAFLEHAKNHSIIHLSTHAEMGTNGNPWIAFIDKKMTLNDIYATKLNSDMVVLSACQTALGDIKKGEGVISLARGFFNAGAKSVVSSLWNVNDKANAKLMSDFYKFLSQGETSVTALHKAKLNYLNTHTGVQKAPHFWGGLILIGESHTITNKVWYSSNTIYTLIIILIVIIALIPLRERLFKD